MTAPRRRPKAEPRSAARRAPEAPRPDRKQQLLAAAKNQFATVGYRAATPESIAAAAGLPESVLARHFPGKSALLAAIVAEIRSATLERWQAETTVIADPLARLHAIADLFLASARDLALEVRVLHRALVEIEDEEVLAQLRHFSLECEALLAGIIAEGQQAGVLRRNLDPRIGAWQLIRTAIGATLLLPLGVPPLEEPDHLPRAVECLLHCLLKTDV
jgi:AcrR family transcriptional regulator